MESVKVTVIIPTYNRMETLKRAITSVFRQTYTNYELLIIDDGSTDDTKKLVTGMNDDRIHYIKSPVNRGAGNARNIGIRAAKGEFIAFQDSDDEWMDTKLEKQVAALEAADDKTGMVYTRFFYDLGEKGRIEYPPDNLSYNEITGDIYQRVLQKNLVGTPTMLIRKECFEKVGMFNTVLRSLEDWDLCIRISKEYRIILVDELLHKAYIMPGSLSYDVLSAIQANCCMLKLYKDDIIRYGLLKDKIAHIQRLAEKINLVDEVTKLISSALQ